MEAILHSAYCIPCILTLLIMLGTFGSVSFIMNSWVPFKGPLPSDGPVEGFASKAARIEFFDTTPMRVRAATKAGIIGIASWILGVAISYFLLTSGGA